jgi:hypothetical protein
MSQSNRLLTSSFFGNGYVTLLDAEIKDYICKHKKSSRTAFIDTFSQRGYAFDDIAEELDRQCYFSTLRYIPKEDTYAGIQIGMNLWHDICARIHDQKSMIAGQLQWRDGRVKVDIFRTDLQPLTLKKKVSALRLRRAPVMRWTKRFTEKNVLKCLGYLLDAVPFTSFHKKEDLSGVLRMIDDVINSKSERRPWACWPPIL